MNSNQTAVPLEIERKFLIAYPDEMLLRQYAASCIKITQTYLKANGNDYGRRIRRSVTDGAVTYTYTLKRRISDLVREEIEHELSCEEYNRLLTEADEALMTVEKKRWCVPYKGQLLEIDVYPFWTDRAIMEIELESADAAYEIPGWLQLIKEVSDDARYLNISLARERFTEALV